MGIRFAVCRLQILLFSVFSEIISGAARYTLPVQDAHCNGPGVRHVHTDVDPLQAIARSTKLLNSSHVQPSIVPAQDGHVLCVLLLPWTKLEHFYGGISRAC